VRRSFLATVLLFAMMALSLSAYARGKSTSVTILQPTQVAGTTLKPGNYDIKVSPNGSTAAVVFSHNGKEVATVTGQVVQLQKKSVYTSVTTDNSGGTPKIAQIDFEGSTSSVSFSQTAAATASGD
jgi:hypothetical protein